MKILVTGLCTLHWGRLEYGNIGNYYIIEPLFRELHRVFPEAEILTTFQMTDAFIQKEKVHVLPMELYYSWKTDDIENAAREYELAQKFEQTGCLSERTAYMEAVLASDLVVNFSGDMWGDNAEHVGHGRFLVDLYKMGTAQCLGKKTVLFGGTPGPFTDPSTVEFAKKIFEHFDLVVNREPTSSHNIEKWGFSMKKVRDFACPAFLYVPQLDAEQQKEKNRVMAELKQGNKALVGFTLGGFNLPVGPYDMWPREDWQYSVFVEAVEHIVNDLGARVVLISHTNGFELPPHFKLINGRDYPILKQLQEIVCKRANIKNAEDVTCIDTPHVPALTKSIIGNFDMMVTGRVHASVAAISQEIPTVFMTYEPGFIPSTKMYGFADLAGVGEFVTEPGNSSELIRLIDTCWQQRAEVRERLHSRIPEVKSLAHEAFDVLAEVVQEE